MIGGMRVPPRAAQDSQAVVVTQVMLDGKVGTAVTEWTERSALLRTSSSHSNSRAESGRCLLMETPWTQTRVQQSSSHKRMSRLSRSNDFHPSCEAIASCASTIFNASCLGGAWTQLGSLSLGELASSLVARSADASFALRLRVSCKRSASLQALRLWRALIWARLSGATRGAGLRAGGSGDWARAAAPPLAPGPGELTAGSEVGAAVTALGLAIASKSKPILAGSG